MLPMTWTALEKLHDHFARTAIAFCNDGKDVSPQLFVVSADEKGTVLQMSVLPPQMMQRFFLDDDGKEMFAAFLKAMLTEGHPLRQTFINQMQYAPDVLVHVTEAWAHSPKADAPDTDDYMTGKKRVSQSPDRTEVVLVTLHTREGSIPVVHKIESKPKRRCVKGAFPRLQDFPLFGGRFAMQEAFGPDGTTH